jgi:hypothetical protein
VDDGSNAFALVHQVEGLVDVFQRHRVGDEFVDLDLAFQILISPFMYWSTMPGSCDRPLQPPKAVPRQTLPVTS